MDVNGGPVTDSVVFMGSDRDDAELREMAEQCVADIRTFPVGLRGNYQEVGRRLLNVVVNGGFVLYLANDLDPGLFGECL